MKILVTFIAGIFICVIPSVFCQEDSSKTDLWKVILTDESELVGIIESENSEQVDFKTVSGIGMKISRQQIKSIKRVEGEIKDGKLIRFDPNHTRLFFAPTARSLKSGQGYFSVSEIFFPFVAIGAGNILTLSGGLSLFPGAEAQLIYLAPKITPLHLKHFDLAGGALYINSTSGGSEGVGILYGVGTLGSSDKALTLGLGWGFAGGEISNEPIFMLGGELQLSNSLKLITENWFPPRTDIAIVSFGLRFFGENLSADLAMVRTTQKGGRGWPFLPWINFAYNFGVN